MYVVLGFDEYVNKEGVKGYAYFVGKEIANGFKPAFTAYVKDLYTDISVNDVVFPDLITGKDGNLIVRGIIKL